MDQANRQVNSSMLQTKISGWPYPAVNAMPSGRLGYHPKTLSSSPSVRTRPTGYDMGFESSVYGRPLVGHGINYEDDYFQSGYMVPNVPDYGMWNQKWNPTVKKELFDQGESFSQYPYMLAPTEVPVVPTVALPDGQDRTLPNPKNQVPSSVPVVPSTPETSGLPFQDFRISPWARTSRPMMTQPLPMNRCKLSQSQSQSQDMFAYLPTTTDPTPSVPSTGVGLEEEYRPEARVRGFSRDSGRLLGLSDCPDIYGYSTSEKKRNESETGSTLMNGLPYTRVRHPDNALTFNLLTDPIPEYRPPTETQRTVSPLGNTGY